jgi:uncharacterized protein (TIGR03435 family)
MTGSGWALRAAVATAGLLALADAAPTAQTALDNQSFDVASIRENTSGGQEGFFRFANGRFTVTNLPVRWIIRWAHDLRDYQVTGLPGWAETRYEVQATYAPPSAGLGALRTMMQGLLTSRFALQAHREVREMRVYHLMKMKDGAALGPRLRPSDVDCSQPAPPPVPLGTGTSPTPRCTAWVNYGMVHGFSRSMPQLAAYLDDLVGAPVIDRTGLSGNWNFDVEWAVPAAYTAPAELRTPPVDAIAGLFAALEDSLGLRLTAARAPVDVLVVESMSRPTPN